jgi:hypothetical protein
MKRHRTRKLVVPLALAGAGALLAAMLRQELATAPAAMPAAVGDAAAKLSPAARTDAANAISTPPLAEFSEMVERPLFRQGRRPPDPPAAEAPPARALDAKLVGILIVEGERIALFRPEAGGEIVAVREGQEVQGWILRKIEAERVVFDGERKQELRLYEEAAGPVAAAQQRPSNPRPALLHRPGAAPVTKRPGP